jgi:hypothetical protein
MPDLYHPCCWRDRDGRAWRCLVTDDVVATFRKSHGRCLAQLVTLPADDFVGALWQDPARLAGLLFLACEPQVHERGASPEQFGRLAAHSVEDSLTALLLAVVERFPRSSVAETLGPLLLVESALKSLCLGGH